MGYAMAPWLTSGKTAAGSPGFRSRAIFSRRRRAKSSSAAPRAATTRTALRKVTSMRLFVLGSRSGLKKPEELSHSADRQSPSRQWPLQFGGLSSKALEHWLAGAGCWLQRRRVEFRIPQMAGDRAHPLSLAKRTLTLSWNAAGCKAARVIALLSCLRHCQVRSYFGSEVGADHLSHAGSGR